MAISYAPLYTTETCAEGVVCHVCITMRPHVYHDHVGLARSAADSVMRIPANDYDLKHSFLSEYNFSIAGSIIGKWPMKHWKHSDLTVTEIFCNAIALTCICLLLFATFTFQFIFRELPCSLCLLQRIGFMGAALGFLMNLRFGLRPSHYAVVLASSLFTSLVALRQIAMHVVPGTGAYGEAIIGFHLYTWSFIISMVILAGTILMLSADNQYRQMNETHMQRFFWVVHLLFGALLLMIGMNIIALLMQCGLSLCPETVTQFMV